MALNVDAAFREVALPGAPLSLDFTNDGQLLACANSLEGDDGPSFHVIRVSDSATVHQYQPPGAQRGRGVAFVNGGRELVYLFQDGNDTTHLYRRELSSRTPTLLKTYDLSIRNHAIIRDRLPRWFAVIGNQVEIWDARTNAVVRTLPGADRFAVVQAAFSRDGKRIYVYGAVKGMVVGYDIESAGEVGRWPAPTELGAQVAVSPDERFLIASGASYKGLFLHDLSTGHRVLHDKAQIRTFDDKEVWRPLAFSHDSSLLTCLRGQVACFRLPTIEGFNVRKTGIDPALRGDAAASAWDAGIVAFGTREDARVRWFHLVEA